MLAHPPEALPEEPALDRVLLDGTTLVFSGRMLAGDEQPSALHLYALGLLVESAILHDQVVVLDTTTTTSGRTLDENAKAYGAGAVTVDRRSVGSVVIEYLEREYPEFEGIAAQPDQGREADEAQAPDEAQAADREKLIDRAQWHLTEVLERTYSDDREMSEYLRLLESVHLDQVNAVAPSWPTGLSRLRPSKWFDVLDRKLFGWSREDATPLGGIKSDWAISSAWEDFVRRYTDAGGRSPWEYAQTLKRSRQRQFGQSLLIRAHFYVLASEVVDAPYRPDGFRAPICWKFFGEGSFAEFGIDEAFVRAAEQAQHEEIASVNSFLRRRAFVGLPFFLARVFQESREAGDVMRVTGEIRESSEARRFREYAARLRRDEDEGNVREIVRELQAVSAVLRKQFGPSERSFDVLWTLAGSGARAAIAQDPVSVVDLGIKSGGAATKSAAGLGAWWHNRKLALISKTVKHARRAKDMQGELRRLFGANLSEGELEVLAHLDRLGQPGEEVPASAE